MLFVKYLFFFPFCERDAFPWWMTESVSSSPYLFVGKKKYLTDAGIFHWLLLSVIVMLPSSDQSHTENHARARLEITMLICGDACVQRWYIIIDYDVSILQESSDIKIADLEHSRCVAHLTDIGPR
jgi:hypothetical protein